MKRLVCALLCAAMLLTGCTAPARQKTRYNATFLTLFDTVTTIVGFAESEEEFRAAAQNIHDELLTYHQLFDIYNDYDGINNLKTINDNAGIAPVEVDRVIIDLLLDCKEYYDLTGGMVNAAMGSVLHLWHEARNDGINDPLNACLPDTAALESAAAHTSMDSVVIDESAGTVFITDSETRLDVGAIAKGYAVEMIARGLEADGIKGYVLNVGGNVRTVGGKKDETPWTVGIENPDGEDYLAYLDLRGEALVTSGSYQRYYTVDGKQYHHIIDPETLMPAEGYRSVSLICKSSADGDALSTALFCMDLTQGMALVASLPDVEALWVTEDGKTYASDGFHEYEKS